MDSSAWVGRAAAALPHYRRRQALPRGAASQSRQGRPDGSEETGMRTLIRFAAWLYPRSWRERYGVEFDALLEDVRPGWRELLNVLKGALAMQIRHFGPMAAGFAVAGALVAGLVSWRMPDKYISQAIVHYWPPEAVQEVPALVEMSTIRSSLMPILKKYKLYGREWTQKPLEDLIDKMRLNIRIHPLRDTAFGVEFRDEDPATARRVVDELIFVLLEKNILDRRAKAGSMPEPLLQRLEVRNPANLPTKPSDPNRRVIYGLGIAIGALTGAVVAWFRRAPHPRKAA